MLRLAANCILSIPPFPNIGFVSWWLNNPSTSVVLDSYDSNTLTNHGSVASTTGFGYIPATAGFNGSNKYLSVASNSALQTGYVDFWVGRWFKTTSAGTLIVVGKSTFAGNGEWLIYISGGQLYFITQLNGGNQGVVKNPATINDNSWHFAFAYQDVENNIIALSVDGGTFVTTAIVVHPNTNTGPLTIGAATSYRLF